MADTFIRLTTDLFIPHSLGVHVIKAVETDTEGNHIKDWFVVDGSGQEDGDPKFDTIEQALTWCDEKAKEF